MKILTPALAFAVLAATAQTPVQPELGTRSAQILTVDGLRFKDLNHNGRLDPYEDWRLTPEQRTADLLSRMSLEDLAGLMVHGTLPTNGSLGSIGHGEQYDLDKTRPFLLDKHINSFITRLNGDARTLAHENNRVQELAETAPLGIPVTVSSDPRHHFEETLGASTVTPAFSQWPEPLGLAAIDDPILTRHFGDAVRQEYIAVGIRESLAPQADLATEPRWPRINGTFGEDPALSRRMVEAYVAGIQNGAKGPNPGSVLAVVKHWAGYGASKDGWDGHNHYGRFAVFSGDADAHFKAHLIPFAGAFNADVAAIMPTYDILQGVTLNGRPLEQVGANFNKQLLTDLLRTQYGFKGVILSDWAVTNDCNANCRNGSPAGVKPSPADIAMSWGVEDIPATQRFAKAINAGVDQVGGTEHAEIIVADVRSGLIPEVRVREAAHRILLQKFQIGLFEQPYADEDAAPRIAGRSDLVKAGEAAQVRATVLLKNAPSPRTTGRPVLPLQPATRVFLYGIDPGAAQAAGLTVVTDPTQADVALLRAPAPFASEHPNYFFGSRQHEGRLYFTADDPAYAELLRLSPTTPVVFLTTLERPIILTDVLPRAVAVLGTFGLADKPLFTLLTGKATPQGHLPFELPRSEAAVQAQESDLPHDSRDPLFPFGFGLRYPGNP